MQVVLDTNIIISGLLWSGTPYRLLHVIHQHSGIQLYSSTVLLEELTDVLTRSAMTKRLNIINKIPHQLITDYLDIIELVEPIKIPQISRDPDDDHVLACALAAQADLIISGDTDLLTLQEYQTIRIVDATTAINLIEQT